MQLVQHKLDQLYKYDSKLSQHLCKEHAHEFDQWWDPAKFDWSYSWILAECCSANFNIWWNPNMFDWNCSWALAEHCSEYFDRWWNPDKYDWENASWALIQYCIEHFDKWWNINEDSIHFCVPSFNSRYFYFFCRYCGEHLNKWLKNIPYLNEERLHVLLTACKTEYIMPHLNQILSKCDKDVIKTIIKNLDYIDKDKLLLILF